MNTSLSASCRRPGSNFPVALGLAFAALLTAPACSPEGTPAGTGGVVGTGGALPGSGGAVGSGGLTASGGAVGTGGNASGGAVGTGGGTGSGGISSSGGAASGGALGSGGGGAGSGGAGSGGGSGFQPCPAAEPCQIVPFGDSITEGMRQVSPGNYTFDGGYRVRLFELAVGDGHDVTFVGNSPNAPNGPDTVAGEPFPKAHEGMSGWTIQQLISKNDVVWKDNAPTDEDPHIVLLHIGTNDINLNQQNGAPDRLETLIDQITTELPDALLVVAKIIPLPSRTSDIDTYNAAMDAIVEEKANAGRHVLLVDMNDQYPDGELPDSIHPSTNGYAWMGEQWYAAIEPYLP